MQSNAYEYAIAIAKHKSITKAAQELCITQPALTKYLNRLEADLGVKLFDRSKSPITATPAGEKFIEKAALILEIERSLQYELNHLSGNTRGTVAVGMNPETCSLCIPYILPEFRFRYPDIEVKLLDGHNRFLFDELRAGNLDLVFTTYTPSGEEFSYDSIYDEPILLAMPASHPIAQSTDLSNNSPLTPSYLDPERVRGCDFISLPPEMGMGTIARHFFNKYHLEPNIVMEGRKHETALRLASTGMGMVFTPVQTPLRIALVKPMAYFSLENPLYLRNRGVYYSRQIPLSDTAQCFINVYRDAFNHQSALRPPSCQLLFTPGTV